MTIPTQTVPCPTCQAANQPGVKFCGQCGTPLAAAAARVAPDSAVPMPTITGNPGDPLAHVREALEREQALVTGGDGQTRLDYELAHRSRLMGPITLHYGGTVTRGPQGYGVTARMLPKSLGIQAVSLVAGCVMLGFVPRTLLPDGMFVFVAASAIGVTIWMTFIEGPKRVRHHLQAVLEPMPGATVTPAAAGSAPPAAAGSSAPADDVFVQLERLAQLQATGLLSADEVAAKKAELLQRI